MLRALARCTALMTTYWSTRPAVVVMMQLPHRTRIRSRPAMTTNALITGVFPRQIRPPHLRPQQSQWRLLANQICRLEGVRQPIDRQLSGEEPKISIARSSPSVAILAPTARAGVDANRHEAELARCQRLAGELGVPLLANGKAGQEAQGVHFVMTYDKEGRLALGQPGSGFAPLAIDFCAGKTGHRAKHQQGTEQVVKAASLPRLKRRRRPHPPPPPRKTIGTNSDANASIVQCGTFGGERSEKEEGEEEEPVLWDLTAGLGTDAFMLASAGWTVKMFERSPVVAALLQDALDRARNSDDDTARATAFRMSLHVGDSATATIGAAASATTAAAAIDSAAGVTVDDDQAEGKTNGVPHMAQRPAVVYLDPMFPLRKKAALVKKGMQMLQALLEMEEDEKDGGGHDRGGGRRVVTRYGSRREEEERNLFEIAMRVATRKVVVKRPVNGPAIVDHVGPSHAVVSKNGRFDVYAVQ